MRRKCEKDKCNKEGNYSSKIGYFCLNHILDYEMVCPNVDCPKKGVVMEKLVAEIKKDINGDMHQIFLCNACDYRHDHKVHV